MRGWEGRSGADGRGLSRGGTGGAYAAGGLARNLLYLGGTCHGQRRGASTRLNRGWSGAWQGCQGLALPGGSARPFFSFRTGRRSACGAATPAVSGQCRQAHTGGKKSAPGGSWNRGNPGDLVPGAEQAMRLVVSRHKATRSVTPGPRMRVTGGVRNGLAGVSAQSSLSLLRNCDAGLTSCRGTGAAGDAAGRDGGGCAVRGAGAGAARGAGTGLGGEAGRGARPDGGSREPDQAAGSGAARIGIRCTGRWAGTWPVSLGKDG